jgi:hypothetical protein
VLGVEARPASLGSAGTPLGGDAPSHFETYANAAVKSNAMRQHSVGLDASRTRSDTDSGTTGRGSNEQAFISRNFFSYLLHNPG